MTNYERIKAMCPEELYFMISCPWGWEHSRCNEPRDKNCIDCFMEWLNSEVEE